MDVFEDSRDDETLLYLIGTEILPSLEQCDKKRESAYHLFGNIFIMIFDEGYHHFLPDYLGPNPKYSDVLFKQISRTSKQGFNKIHMRVVERGIIVRRVGAAKCRGIHLVP